MLECNLCEVTAINTNQPTARCVCVFFLVVCTAMCLFPVHIYILNSYKHIQRFDEVETLSSEVHDIRWHPSLAIFLSRNIKVKSYNVVITQKHFLDLPMTAWCRRILFEMNFMKYNCRSLQKSVGSLLLNE